MANANAPTGFRHVGSLSGGAYTMQYSVTTIASNYATKIYDGDPVVRVAAGGIQLLSPGTDPVEGIFWGCKYVSVATGETRFSRMWPGGDAVSGSVQAWITNDPFALFEVQATLGPITAADVGSNVQVTIGTGNDYTQQSGASVTTPATTATLPFRVHSVNVFGSDPASAYNRVVVVFNNQSYRQLTGIHT